MVASDQHASKCKVWLPAQSTGWIVWQDRIRASVWVGVRHWVEAKALGLGKGKDLGLVRVRAKPWQKYRASVLSIPETTQELANVFTICPAVVWALELLR